MAAETQAFIDEVKTPTHKTPAAIRAAIVALVPEMGDAGQQVELWGQLLQAAEMAETDAALRQLMEEGFQKLGAMQREGREMMRHARKVAAIHRELQEWYTQRFGPAATDAGYTV